MLKPTILSLAIMILGITLWAAATDKTGFAGVHIGDQAKDGTRTFKDAVLFGHKGNILATSKNGKVIRLVFIDSLISDMDSDEIRNEFRSKMIDFYGVQSSPNEWRFNNIIVRLAFGPYWETETRGKIIIVMSRPAPADPGNPNDGFKEFLDALRMAISEDDATTVSKSFKFPFKDSYSSVYKEGKSPKMEFKNAAQFVENYHRAFTAQRKKDFLEGTPHFEPYGSVYTIWSDPSLFIIKRQAGKWLVSEYAYQE